MSYMPGLASATGTRFDSAAKHNMACKVDGSLIRTWMNDKIDKEAELNRNKYKYAMQKDELVMNVGIKMSPQNAVTRPLPKAYPSVITTLADLDDKTRLALMAIYASPTAGDFFQRIVSASTDLETGTKKIRDMPLFQAQGYALGTAYASAVSGDTVATVMVGGIVTVLNGAYTMRAGQ